MALSLHFPKIFSTSKHAEKSRASSTYSCSSERSFQEAAPQHYLKYIHDPMRHNNCPDYVGSFIDPMGGRRHYAQSYDITNTGA
ncbi:hypothetical protein BX666DRAFT_1936794 [Dichotomocladium elegans]|nr:hypothetical protein BX666DRAFT_1936794 [Dichotomocladium elegans]